MPDLSRDTATAVAIRPDDRRVAARAEMRNRHLVHEVTLGLASASAMTGPSEPPAHRTRTAVDQGRLVLAVGWSRAAATSAAHL